MGTGGKPTGGPSIGPGPTPGGGGGGTFNLGGGNPGGREIIDAIEDHISIFLFQNWIPYWF